MELHEALYARGLHILAFPCNQFGKQEPGSAEDIRAFADGYGVQFDIFAKTDVNGPKTHPGMRNFTCVFKLGRSACLAFGILPELCFQPDTLACPPYLTPMRQSSSSSNRISATCLAALSNGIGQSSYATVTVGR